jgi:hypothetical protein
MLILRRNGGPDGSAPSVSFLAAVVAYRDEQAVMSLSYVICGVDEGADERPLKEILRQYGEDKFPS